MISSVIWQRITILEILEDEWFKKDYKSLLFEEKEDTNLDDVEAVFKDSEVCWNASSLGSKECSKSLTAAILKDLWHKLLVSWQEHHVTEKKEEQPTAMNAFELISMSKGLNLGNLFEVEQVSLWEGFLAFIRHIHIMPITIYKDQKLKFELVLPQHTMFYTIERLVWWMCATQKMSAISQA